MNVAVAYGATVRQGTRVADVDVLPDKVVLRDHQGRTVEARYLVDCSGYRSPTATKLGLREEPTHLKHVSRCLFTHMIGVKPYDDCVHPPNIHGMPIPWFQSTLHHVFDGGWIWVIPFNNHKRSTNQLCSVGLTLDPRRYPSTGMPAEEEWRKVIASFPSVVEQFRGASTIRPWVSTQRLQYSSTRAVGERYCLVGHAYGFVDALFSRGLAITMDVINTLAGRVLGALRADDFSMSRFEYVETFTKNLVEYNDQLVNCAFISFADYRLLNAWLRVWAIGEAGLDQLRILKASLRSCAPITRVTSASGTSPWRTSRPSAPGASHPARRRSASSRASVRASSSRRSSASATLRSGSSTAA
jgi:FADH2 O2-dependent halogenase